MVLGMVGDGVRVDGRLGEDDGNGDGDNDGVWKKGKMIQCDAKKELHKERTMLRNYDAKKAQSYERTTLRESDDKRVRR